MASSPSCQNVTDGALVLNFAAFANRALLPWYLRRKHAVHLVPVSPCVCAPHSEFSLRNPCFLLSFRKFTSWVPGHLCKAEVLLSATVRASSLFLRNHSGINPATSLPRDTGGPLSRNANSLFGGGLWPFFMVIFLFVRVSHHHSCAGLDVCVVPEYFVHT